MNANELCKIIKSVFHRVFLLKKAIGGKDDF